ncbi:jg23341 [Pararge aegeria aegeria]|uniref:Jg23341 protein n=1 Tax=Pararge aegeria aegeria TaxID=348720 RepID=A0A8S4R8J6_9NEOP|nr:jg23341 [Pararge aegeria aegeria]
MANLSRFNAGNNYHSVFGEGGDTSTPPLLDLSEFPSLTARGAGDQAPTAAPPPPGSKPYVQKLSTRAATLQTSEEFYCLKREDPVTRSKFPVPVFSKFYLADDNRSQSPYTFYSKAYVGMVKQPTSEQSEFTMSSEDFPALPGTSAGTHVPEKPAEYTHAPDKPARKGIQTSPDGKVTNIPETMIPNQYGIVGLLTFIRAAESDPSLVSLALGQDLTALGLNLNSPDNLYLTFAGPWADTPCRPQDMDYHVPPEYLINGSIREKLAPLRLSRYKEDLLFYLFYCFVGDVLQIAAAAELYNREWRYHMEEKVWISQAPGMPMVEKTSTYERGTYYFFDAHNWRKVAKEFHLDYSKLEGRPQLPPHVIT